MLDFFFVRVEEVMMMVMSMMIRIHRDMMALLLIRGPLSGVHPTREHRAGALLTSYIGAVVT